MLCHVLLHFESSVKAFSFTMMVIMYKVIHLSIIIFKSFNFFLNIFSPQFDVIAKQNV